MECPAPERLVVLQSNLMDFWPVLLERTTDMVLDERPSEGVAMRRLSSRLLLEPWREETS